MGEQDEQLKDLIIRAKEGDQGAFEKVYTNYYTPIYRFILIRTKDKDVAEEMSQDVFLKIWNYLPNWKENHTSPISFFFTVARNSLIDYFRREKNRVIFSDEVILRFAEETGSDEDYKEKETREAIHEAVSNLTEEQQEVIIMLYTNDLTYKEISEITGKKEDAIRQTHSRAIKRLREIYKL